jgi:hypothetical protein
VLLGAFHLRVEQYLAVNVSGDRIKVQVALLP